MKAGRSLVLFGLLTASAAGTFLAGRRPAAPAVGAASSGGMMVLRFTDLAGGDTPLCPDGVIRVRARLEVCDWEVSEVLRWSLVVERVAWHRWRRAVPPPVVVATRQSRRFVVPAGVRVTPTFAEDVSVPPGDYSYTISVHSLRSGVVARETDFARVGP